MRQFKSENIPKPRSSVCAPLGEFDLEIGCGVGLHPIQYAMARPERTLVAIERTHEKFEKFQRRYQAHGMPKNLLPVHDDAINWVTHNVKEQVLGHVFVLYPNPEPSNKNQRLAHMPFVDFLHSRMISSGTLTIATNIKDYADECASLLVTRGFELLKIETPQLPGRTHFERKYLARGEACFNLSFQRK